MRRLWPSNLLITFSLGISDDQTPSREVGNNSVHVQSDPHWYLHGLYGNPFLGHCHVTAETLDLPGREWSSYSFITCLLVHCTCYHFGFKRSLEYNSETSVVTTKRVIDIIRINFKLIDYRGTCNWYLSLRWCAIYPDSSSTLVLSHPSSVFASSLSTGKLVIKINYV